MGEIATASASKFRLVVNSVIVPALRASGISPEQWDALSGYDDLGSEVVAFMKATLKKPRGKVTPVRAQESGLVPEGWLVPLDRELVEGEVDLSKLRYLCPFEEGDPQGLPGKIIVERALQLGAYGSLGFAAAMLKEQGQGKEIFPSEFWTSDCQFLLPLTQVLMKKPEDSFRRLHVPLFSRDLAAQGQWSLKFRRIEVHCSRKIRLILAA